MRCVPGIIAAVACSLPVAASAADLEATTTPYPGVVHEVWIEPAIPARVHLVRVDLTSQEVNLLATDEANRGITPSAFASATGAQIVVNGDYFTVTGYGPAGLAVGAGLPWADTADDADEGIFRFDRNGDLNHAQILAPEGVLAAPDLPLGTRGVVSGRPMVVRAGVAQSRYDCADLVAMPCSRAPRTAVALDASANTLWLAVVDGWQSGSVGMTGAELGLFLRDRGARDAMLLDGGASAALFIEGEGGVVSSPSDGAERAVANHVGVFFGDLPGGTLLGFVRECDLFDTTKPIDGVAVELDNGQTVTTNAEGRYIFTDVTPRYACVTASKTGYITKTKCRQVAAGADNFNSMGLTPEDMGCNVTPPADAGPPGADASPLAPDAAPGADSGGGGADAGDDDKVDGDCACRVGERTQSRHEWVWVAMMGVALALRKRRRR